MRKKSFQEFNKRLKELLNRHEEERSNALFRFAEEGFCVNHLIQMKKINDSHNEEINEFCRSFSKRESTIKKKDL